MLGFLYVYVFFNWRMGTIHIDNHFVTSKYKGSNPHILPLICHIRQGNIWIVLNLKKRHLIFCLTFLFILVDDNVAFISIIYVHIYWQNTKKKTRNASRKADNGRFENTSEFIFNSLEIVHINFTPWKTVSEVITNPRKFSGFPRKFTFISTSLQIGKLDSAILLIFRGIWLKSGKRGSGYLKTVIFHVFGRNMTLDWNLVSAGGGYGEAVFIFQVFG